MLVHPPERAVRPAWRFAIAQKGARVIWKVFSAPRSEHLRSRLGHTTRSTVFHKKDTGQKKASAPAHFDALSGPPTNLSQYRSLRLPVVSGDHRRSRIPECCCPAQRQQRHIVHKCPSLCKETVKEPLRGANGHCCRCSIPAPIVVWCKSATVCP